MDTLDSNPETQPLEPTPQPAAIEIIDEGAAYKMSTEDLRRAAFGQEQPAQQQPEQHDAQPQPQPEPEQGWQVSQLANGSFEVKLDTGEIFRGKDATEALNQLGKAMYHTKRWAQETKKWADEHFQNPQLPADPAQEQAEQEAQRAALDQQKQWFRENILDEDMKLSIISDAIGVPKDELGPMWNGMQQQVRSAQLQNTAATFQSEHPEYIDTPENNQVMVDAVHAVAQQMGPSYIPTPQDLHTVYTSLLYAGRIKAPPLHSGKPVPPPPRPPAMPSTGSGPTPEQDPWSMPKDQLRKYLADNGLL